MQKIEIEGTTYLLIKECDYLNGTVDLKENASKAMSLLTCLELDAAKILFEELNGTNDIILVTVAIKAKVANSVVSSMLKKLSANNIVEYGNMGSRGLRIKLLNEEFKNMIAKI